MKASPPKDDPYPANFSPNFRAAFSVTVLHPMATVFQVLGTGAGLERTILLSSMAGGFELLMSDSVAVVGALEDAYVRTARAAPEGEGLPRQSFRFMETVKIVPGFAFLDVNVKLQGTFTWDAERRVALYETWSDKVVVRKVRRFEEAEGGAATKISETIEGQCPALLQYITQRTAQSSHREHMNSYSELFE
ncbi:hypothetical protein B0H15DRAFT_865217 [Mycena belliarum]|uniref:Uncharacterized protein n=1 Tax=Mycena belliarum TaxID=1033014 RepID=A0AAD6TS42_9AGAR|nr:hypothetical protein B0H15DRAFT_865217 [Mycena belliae]